MTAGVRLAAVWLWGGLSVLAGCGEIAPEAQDASVMADAAAAGAAGGAADGAAVGHPDAAGSAAASAARRGAGVDDAAAALASEAGTIDPDGSVDVGECIVQAFDPPIAIEAGVGAVYCPAILAIAPAFTADVSLCQSVPFDVTTDAPAWITWNARGVRPQGAGGTFSPSIHGSHTTFTCGTPGSQVEVTVEADPPGRPGMCQVWPVIMVVDCEAVVCQGPPVALPDPCWDGNWDDAGIEDTFEPVGDTDSGTVSDCPGLLTVTANPGVQLGPCGPPSQLAATANAPASFTWSVEGVDPATAGGTFSPSIHSDHPTFVCDTPGSQVKVTVEADPPDAEAGSCKVPEFSTLSVLLDCSWPPCQGPPLGQPLCSSANGCADAASDGPDDAARAVGDASEGE